MTKGATSNPAPSPTSLKSAWGRISTDLLGGGTGLATLALGVYWLLFFGALRGEWQVNPQYSYGYLVPLLGIALFLRRWQEHPPASVRSPTPTLIAVSAGLLLLMMPLRLVFEANPEWRLLYWFNGFQMVGLTACFLYYLGGWPWVRLFWFPTVFMLIAVPWPMQWEQMLIQGLMRLVAGLTVGVVDLLGVPAVQHGNLVEIGAGVIGIDEACSGVRSLQSALMLSLFLGELYRLPLARRLGLIGASLFFDLLANVARTSFLVWAAANRGLHQMEAWHDMAGNLVMLIVLPCLMFLAWLLKPNNRGARAFPTQLKTLPQLPRLVGLGALVWLAVTEAGVEAWYRLHEADLISNIRWSVAWPSNTPEFKKSALPDRSLAILRCSDSDAASWRDEDGNRWSGFVLRWAPGKNSAQLAKGHSPDICFTASGARMVSDLGQVVVSAHRLELPFRHLLFENGAAPFHVFYCLWSDRYDPRGEQSSLEDGSQVSRLKNALAGKRNLGQQAVEIVISEPVPGDEAVALLKKELPGWIQSDPPGLEHIE